MTVMIPDGIKPPERAHRKPMKPANKSKINSSASGCGGSDEVNQAPTARKKSMSIFMKNGHFHHS